LLSGKYEKTILHIGEQNRLIGNIPLLVVQEVSSMHFMTGWSEVDPAGGAGGGERV